MRLIYGYVCHQSLCLFCGIVVLKDLMYSGETRGEVPAAVLAQQTLTLQVIQNLLAGFIP